MVSILILMSSCDKELAELDENKVLKKLSVQEQELINATNSLSIDILKTEYAQNNDDNFMFSPISVGMALGMIYNGVGEEEKMQIQNTMGIESLVEKEINKSYNELLSFFQVANDQVNISYANSLWFSDNINIQEDYRTRVMAYYDAEISELNFMKSSSLDLINSWGSLKTHGNFENLISIVPSKDIFLVNAFSLNTGWKNNVTNFQTPRDFYNSKGEKLEVNTNNWDGLNVRINENEAYLLVEIPFENDQILLSVIQPEEYVSLKDLVASFTLVDLQELSEEALEFKANVSLPKINFSADRSIKKTLSTIGLSKLFLSSTDLSPSFLEQNSQISEINHLAKINLDKNQIDLESSSFNDSNLKSFFVNKPFVYFVKDKYTQTVLFAGYYQNPE